MRICRIFIFTFFLIFLVSLPRLAHGSELPISSQERNSSGKSISDKHILLLYSNVLGLPAHRKNSDAFLANIEMAGIPLTNVHYEFLDLVRNNSSSYKDNIRHFLSTKYANTSIDIIITVEGAAEAFILDEGRTLFKNAPVISVLSPHNIEAKAATRKLLKIPADTDFKGTLESIWELFPATKKIFMVIGASEDEKHLLASAIHSTKEWEGKISFEFTNTFSHNQMLAKASELKSGAVAMYVSFYRDMNGKSFVPKVVAEELLNSIRVPVFGIYDGLLGLGIVGGSLFSYEIEGEHAAKLAIDFLSGKANYKENFTLLPSLHKKMFDWRQIVRWERTSHHFSPRTVLINKPPSLWSQHRDFVLVVSLAMLVQTLLVFTLGIQVMKRRKMEKLLLEAHDEVKHASNAKSHFIASMSHELRTPLHGIIGFADMLACIETEDQKRSMIESINQCGMTLLALVNDILDLSRIESGTLKLVDAEFSLQELFSEIYYMFNLRFERKKIEFIAKVDDEIPKIIRGDALRVKQVLLNLIQNSYKFTNSGSVRLMANFVSRVENTWVVRIIVADTGQGIPKHKMKTLFERFSSSHDLLNEPHKGAGLGLSIVKELVLLMKGSIEFESSEEVGTTFYIEIPFQSPCF